MSIETIVAICVPLIALIFTALTFKKNADKDTGATAAERATMNANISYIRSSIDEIKLDNKTIQKATESYRITDEKKQYLKSLKINTRNNAL